MYIVKLDNHTGSELTIYDPRIVEKDYAILNPDCELKEGKSGSFIFDVLPAHPHYGDFHKQTSEITVYDDGEWMYTGRVLNDESDFDNIKTIQTEGELSYLLDSIQPIKEYHNYTLRAYLEDIVSIHNSQVDVWKRFTVGTVTVTDSNDSLYRYSNYEKTKDLLDDKLVSRLGGYLRVRHENGVRYLDYLAGNTRQNTQKINFGVNLLDFRKYVKGENIATVLIPLGKKEESEDDGDSAAEVEPRLTIASVNNNSIFLENAEAIALYGRIVDTVIFDDVTTASALKSKGTAELAARSTLAITLEINAFDMHIFNPLIEKIRVSDAVEVISPPHGIDILLPVTEIHPDIFNPDGTKYTIGATIQSLTDKTNESKTKSSIQKVVEAYGYGQKITNNTTVVNTVKNEFSLFKTGFDDAGYASEDYVNNAVGGINALPSVTASDNGKILQVVNGVWTLVTNSGGSTSRLPSEYQEVAWIKSNGYQYIDTGVNAKTGTKSELSLEFVNVPSDASVLAARASSTRIYLLHVYPSGTPCLGYGNYYSADFTITANTQYSIVTELSSGSQTMSIDDVTVISQSIATEYDINYNFALFGMNNAGIYNYRTSVKLYTCKIYSDNQLVRDFVPCYIKETSEVGLFDMVSETFFGNAGTGEFISGPNV